MDAEEYNKKMHLKKVAKKMQRRNWFREIQERQNAVHAIHGTGVKSIDKEIEELRCQEKRR